MPEPPQLNLNNIAIVVALLVQIGGLAWVAATMNSAIYHNQESLREINSKLSSDLDQTELRLRVAEQELFILKTLVEIELKLLISVIFITLNYICCL